MRRMIVLPMALIAAAALPAPAHAVYRGHLLGHTKSSGSSSAADIGWGPHLRRSVKRPASFTVVVRGTLKPGYFCHSSCREVGVQWDVACSKPGRVSSRQGGMFGKLPRVGYPRRPFTHPRSCTVSVRANASSYVGGRIELWLFYRR